MTLQEKIDKLPLSIYRNNLKYELYISTSQESIDLQYWNPLTEDFICVQNHEVDLPLSQRLEDVVDRALTKIRMGTIISKEAYEKLINEDVEWLVNNTEQTLERDHIVSVLKQSTKLLYEKDN